MIHNKTLKEIAQITFERHEEIVCEDKLAAAAAVIAVEECGYNTINCEEYIELSRYCATLIKEEEGDWDIDEDSPKGRFEMRLDYCNDDPERAAEIWGDYEDDCTEALSKIKVLEAEITLLKGSLTEVIEAQGALIEPAIAVMLGFEADEYLWYLGENDYESYFTDALMIEFNDLQAKRMGGEK